MRNSGVVGPACAASGISRSLVYKRRASDPVFASAWKEAEVQAIDMLETVAFERAVNGVMRTKPIYHRGIQVGEEAITEYSDGLLMFLLRARRPDVYRDHKDPNYNITLIRQETRRIALERGLDADALYDEAP